jgi:hypothetical protein
MICPTLRCYSNNYSLQSHNIKRQVGGIFQNLSMAVITIQTNHQRNCVKCAHMSSGAVLSQEETYMDFTTCATFVEPIINKHDHIRRQMFEVNKSKIKQQMPRVWKD